jgi:hypothetical protein
MRRFIRVLSLFVVGFSVVVTLSSCEEDVDNTLAKAQQCLNKVVAPGDAQACKDMVEGIEKPEAYAIKCSASFFLGGLTTTKIVNAFTLFDDAADNEKEAVLIENLALTSAPAANSAYDECSKAGIPGLLKIAALVQIGTIVNLQPGADIGAKIDQCVNFPGTCNLTGVAQSAVLLADSYCKGESVDEQICIDIASAQASAGGDLAVLATLLLNQIKP